MEEVLNETVRKGYVGRVNYNYSGKYLFQFNFRYDGSFNFPQGKDGDSSPSFGRMESQ